MTWPPLLGSPPESSYEPKAKRYREISQDKIARENAAIFGKEQ
jgi:hypothetical protein